MKEKNRYGSGLYAYLEASGVLNGSTEAITSARKTYLNECKRRSIQSKRKREHNFSVWFTDAELKVVTEMASLCNLSKTRFIKQAALAQAQRKPISFSCESANEVKVALFLQYTIIQELFDRGQIPYEIGIVLLQNVESIERKCIPLFNQPKL